ncbi:GTP-binding protein [Dongia sp.]|uniref:flagellar biosynthesis protein FlhF n=1 Tax=Dongia sp. TaxID=1977262 RepID=UPI0035B4615B
MRLRTFNAPNMKDAMALVKAELGPDAIILNVEQIGQAIKITAALDRDAILAPLPEPALDPLEAISQALEFHRVSPALADRLTQQAAQVLLENPQQALAAALRLRFPVQPLTDRLPTRPLMLVGMPGAGKTATLAKLVARAKLKQWPAIAITCDVVKAGAVEQLGTYTKALQIPAYRAGNPATLRKAVEQAPKGAFVIIDTVGCNPLNATDLSYLNELADAVKAEMVLVMAAGGCSVESAELGQLFAETGVNRLIPTRIDAARRYGGILGAAEAGRLSFAEFGVSPEIATGLDIVGADKIAAWLLETAPASTHLPRARRQANGTHS